MSGLVRNNIVFHFIMNRTILKSPVWKTSSDPDNNNAGQHKQKSGELDRQNTLLL